MTEVHAPSSLSPGRSRPAAWQRWVGDVLLPSYLAQPVANATGAAANDPTARLFSFNPGKVSVPSAQSQVKGGPTSPTRRLCLSIHWYSHLQQPQHNPGLTCLGSMVKQGVPFFIERQKDVD